MEILSTALAYCIALLGTPSGYLIASITKEELKAGMRYFRWGIITCLMIIAALLVSSIFAGFKDYTHDAIASLIFIIGLFAGSISYHQRHNKKNKKR